jgi:hypothetical protein
VSGKEVLSDSDSSGNDIMMTNREVSDVILIPAFTLLILCTCCVQIADSIPSKILPTKSKRMNVFKKKKGKRPSGTSTRSNK